MYLVTSERVEVDLGAAGNKLVAAFARYGIPHLCESAVSTAPFAALVLHGDRLRRRRRKNPTPRERALLPHEDQPGKIHEPHRAVSIYGELMCWESRPDAVRADEDCLKYSGGFVPRSSSCGRTRVHPRRPKVSLLHYRDEQKPVIIGYNW